VSDQGRLRRWRRGHQRDYFAAVSVRVKVQLVVAPARGGAYHANAIVAPPPIPAGRGERLAPAITSSNGSESMTGCGSQVDRWRHTRRIPGGRSGGCPGRDRTR
jgi:hypothetical protein